MLILTLIYSLIYLTGIDGVLYKVCDGNLGKLECTPGKIIRIDDVSYCLDGVECNSRGCCNPDASPKVIKKLCNNHKTCEFHCDGYLLGGKCPDGKKCLTIDYSCVVEDPIPPQCGINEVWTSCRTACPAMCPDPCNPAPKFCTAQCLPPGCACKPGYLRDRNTGTCLKPAHCPTYGETNEVFSKCGVNFQKFCSTCEPGYVCKSPYKRESYTGYCVEPDKCPTCPS